MAGFDGAGGTDPTFSVDQTKTITANPETVTLNQTYRTVRVLILGGTAFDVVSLQLNEDTGSNYEYTDHAAVRTTGATEINRVATADKGGQVIYLSGTWGDSGCSINPTQSDTFDQETVTGGYSGASPLNSITFLGVTGDMDIRIEGKE